MYFKFLEQVSLRYAKCHSNFLANAIGIGLRITPELYVWFNLLFKARLS